MKEPINMQIMPKEISALNTFWLVQYLQEKYPWFDMQEVLAQVTDAMPCYVENLYNGEVEALTLDHLKNPRYWFSHEFVKAIHDRVQASIEDPRLGYKIGRDMYKTQPLIRTTLGMSLLGVHRVAAKISSEASKYNRTKEYQVRKLDKGYVEIRIVHKPGIVISEFTMQWNAGCFATYGKLAGASEVVVDLKCIDAGPKTKDENRRAVWDFYIRYQEPPLVTRLAKAALRCFPWIRKLTEDAEAVEAAHQDQIFYRDRIIQERTNKLLQIQQRLISEERKSIENKLRDISRELVSTEERERKAIAEDLHDSVTQLLALSLAKVRSMQEQNLHLEELGELREHLEQSLAELRSLTFQISPPVLYDFGLEAALEWLIEDVNSRYDMQLIYTNMLENSLPFDQEQRVALYRVIRELVINILKHAETPHGQVLLRNESGGLVIDVEDEGIGFSPENATRGFGLSTLADRLICLQGKVSVDSIPGEGTFIRVSVPLDVSEDHLDADIPSQLTVAEGPLEEQLLAN